MLEAFSKRAKAQYLRILHRAGFSISQISVAMPTNLLAKFHKHLSELLSSLTNGAAPTGITESTCAYHGSPQPPCWPHLVDSFITCREH